MTIMGRRPIITNLTVDSKVIYRQWARESGYSRAPGELESYAIVREPWSFSSHIQDRSGAHDVADLEDRHSMKEIAGIGLRREDYRASLRSYIPGLRIWSSK